MDPAKKLSSVLQRLSDAASRSIFFVSSIRAAPDLDHNEERKQPRPAFDRAFAEWSDDWWNADGAGALHKPQRR